MRAFNYQWSYKERKEWAKNKQNQEWNKGYVAGLLTAGAVVGYYFVLVTLWRILWN